MSSTSEAAVRAAHIRRAELLAQERWFDTSAVSVSQGGSSHDTESGILVRKLRHTNKLFGVWNGVQYLHPAFQFDPSTGALLPQMHEILEMFPPQYTEWRQCFWFFTPHAALGGKTPADAFATDPKAAVQAAKITLQPNH